MDTNLSQKKSEVGQPSHEDRFLLGATPRWFEWVEWLFVISAIQFIVQRSPSLLEWALLAISYGMVFGYVQALSFSLALQIPGIQSNGSRRVTSIIIAALLSGALMLLIWNAVARLTANS